MIFYRYDGSFEGLLSCIFEIYRSRRAPINIVAEDNYQGNLLDESLSINTCKELAERVLVGIDARTDDRASSIIYNMFLTELLSIEMSIYHFIKVVMEKSNPAILENFANPYILHAAQLQKMIRREVHRMHAFVRFKKLRDGIFCAVIEPDFNVLPLLDDHFIRRYADQPWVIVDTKRQYGLYYDLQEATFVELDHPIFSQGLGEGDNVELDKAEDAYQALWVNYFHAVNIKERKNSKLHLRHVPKRYWKYLIEKKL